MSNLAEILTRRGDYPRAEKLLMQTHDVDVRALGPDDPNTALSTYNLACLKLREGDRKAALRLLQDAVDHGLANWVIAGMSSDPDLKPLHSNPQFLALVAIATQRIVTQQTAKGQ